MSVYIYIYIIVQIEKNIKSYTETNLLVTKLKICIQSILIFYDVLVVVSLTDTYKMGDFTSFGTVALSTLIMI